MTIITSGSISWDVSGSPTNGTYVTGDPWVVGPVTVSSVTPAWDGTTNGSMVNPSTSGTTQGYDNRAGMNFTYSSGDNVTFPLALGTGQSLISTIGKVTPDSGGGATHIAKASILTCLASSPPTNSFRPPYVGATKTAWSTADVNYGLLRGLAIPSGTSAIDMSDPSNYANRVLLEHGNINSNLCAQIMPEDHVAEASNGYTHHVALQLSRMALLCHCNTAQAQSVANRLIQHGIDLYPSRNDNTQSWARSAGFGSGRKWPILFAGLMLNDSGMQNPPLYVTGSSGQFKFQEDAYTYYGPDNTARWGEDCAITDGDFTNGNHTCRPTLGNADQWRMAALGGAEGATAGDYEVCCDPRAFIGPSLACRLMYKKALWNHNEFFDYTKRFIVTLADEMAADGRFVLNSNFQIDINKYGGDGGLFMKRMWEIFGEEALVTAPVSMCYI